MTDVGPDLRALIIRARKEASHEGVDIAGLSVARLLRMSVPELRKIARELDVPVTLRMRKGDLVVAVAERREAVKGLSQAQVAKKAGVSAIWLRQIETGQAQSASADLLGRICYELEIDSIIVGAIGYPDVAAAIDACVMIRENAIPDHVIDNPHPRKMRKKSPEEHLRVTPGITPRERKLLIEALNLIRKQPA